MPYCVGENRFQLASLVTAAVYIISGVFNRTLLWLAYIVIKFKNSKIQFNVVFLEADTVV